MNTLLNHKRSLSIFIGASIAIHLMILLSLGRFGHYDFTTPLKLLAGVTIDLSAQSYTPISETDVKDTPAESVPDDVSDDEDAGLADEVDSGASSPELDTQQSKLDSVEPVDPIITTKPVNQAISSLSPLRSAAEFLPARSEKLSYLISLFGIPVASAELEAVNKNGELWITLRTRSNAEVSSFYSVDDLLETRHMGGNFIISRFRQHEGSLISDTGFTIFLREKRVFWFDRIHHRYSDETVPNSEVQDILSSVYQLRNRPLQVGKSELLHIYDGENYALIPLEIVRHEEMRLRNLQKVDTLQVHYTKQSGVFRRVGDVTAWLTNDENKVPIRVEASTLLGKITVELISSETTPSL
jgi:hypothetical protein